MVHVTLCHLSYLSRFLCSAVEDFVVDIVKAWSRIKQNNTAIESVILKVSFHSFLLYSLWCKTFHPSPNEGWHYTYLSMYHVPKYMPSICPHLDGVHQACMNMAVYQNMLQNIYNYMLEIHPHSPL